MAMIGRKRSYGSTSSRYQKRFKGTYVRRGTATNFVSRPITRFRPNTLTVAAPKRVELKRVDYFLSQAFKEQSLASCELVNGIAVGDDVFNREGRSVQFKGVEIKAIVTAPSQTSISSFAQDDLRLLVVYDSAPNGGSVPPTSDILRDIAQAGGAYTIALAHQNVNNMHRYKILYDKAMSSPAWNIGNTNFQHDFSAVINRKIAVNKMMNFTGTGGTIASISHGAIYVLCVCQIGNPVSPAAWWTLTGTVRSYFADV